MTSINEVAPLSILPDRFEISEFTSWERETILGESADKELSRDNFNWLGAYLIEQVGLYESEVTEWFKSESLNLNRQTPLSLWSQLDGFEKVFDYAKDYKTFVDEALGDEKIETNSTLVRSHGIAHSALDIIFKGFKAVKVDLSPRYAGDTNSYTLSNPNKPTSPLLRWKGNGVLEDYRITINEGRRSGMYYVVRHIGGLKSPMILQSGVIEWYDEVQQNTSSDSDINGRAPSAGEVAAYVIPLANEIKNHGLSLVNA